MKMNRYQKSPGGPGGPGSLLYNVSDYTEYYVVYARARVAKDRRLSWPTDHPLQYLIRG